MKPPVILNAVNGVLDLNSVTGQQVFVRIERYLGIRPGDIITVYFGEYLSNKIIVPYQSPFNNYFDASFNKDDIINGRYKVYYEVQDLAENIGVSREAVVEVINSSASVLPAPVFPDAIDGVLRSQSILAKDGTEVQASYANMQEGDKIVFYWQGTNALGALVSESQYSSAELLVSAEDKNKHAIKTLIPKEYILVLGQGGNGASYYTLIRKNGGAYGQSLSSSVSIYWKYLSILNISSTQGAVPRINNYPYLQSRNVVTVFGQPSSKVNISVVGGALLEGDRSSGTLIKGTLDKNGMFRCGVFANESFSSGSVIINVDGDEDFQIPSMTNTTFESLYIGTSGVYRYSFTNYAIADGEDICSIYLLGEKNIKFLYVSVEGDALINGWQQTLKVPLHTDGSATVNLVSQSPGHAKVKISSIENATMPLAVNVTFLSVGDLVSGN